MTTVKTITALGACCLTAATATAALRTNVWQGAASQAGNRPSTAYDWGDTANWSLGELPQLGDLVKFPTYSSACYVKLPPGGAEIRSFIGGDNLHVIGDSLTVGGDNQSRPGVTKAVRVYADFTNGVEIGTMHPYLASVTLAGRFFSPYKEPTPAWGTVKHRPDRYATSPDPVRTDDFQVGENVRYFPGSGNVEIYAPSGCAASTSPWSQTEGSPYLQPLTTATKTVSVGTTVTGEGIPEGAFVKRWFENGDIELSQAVTTTVASNDVTFAAFAPELRARIANFSRQSVIETFFVFYKYRDEDVARVEIDKYSVGAMQDNVYGMASTAAYKPGTIVLHDVTSYGATTTTLRNCHFEFAGTDKGQPTTFAANNVFRFHTSATLATTARMTVTNGIAAAIGRFEQWSGTVVKDGAGELSIGLCGADNAGRLSIEAGTVNLCKSTAAGDGEVALGSLTMKAGATLYIPEGVVTVSAIDAEDGAVISGPGRLVLRVGARGGRIVGTPEARVAGHPAFWVDASKESSIVFTEENGTNFVTRWNDCREGEPMFCTNIFYRPQYVRGAAATNRYIRIGRRSPCPTQTYADTEQLVWSVPLKDIRAVFLVQDPTEGGGEILGRSSRLPNSYYGSQGGPYYRGASFNYWRALVSGSYYTPCVYNGWFYLNGKQVTGDKTGYLGAYLQLVEHEVNPAYWASTSVQRLACDAFGAGYGEKKGTYIDNANGCMRIAEYIIYTNALTHVERVETAQYLSRKWLGKDVAYTEFDDRTGSEPALAAVGETVEVADDHAFSFDATSGGGRLVKTGGGLLRTANFRPDGLVVEAGEVVVDSFSLDASNMPENPWLHVDASDAASVTHDPETKAVTQWDDPTTGKSLRPIADTRITGTPTYRATTALGRATVDLGVQGDAAASALRVYKADGTTYVHSNSGSESYIDSPYLRSTFFVFGSAGGGGSLLGSWSDGYPQQGYPHYKTAEGAPMFCVQTNYSGMLKNFATACSNGTNLVRLNGVACDPFVEPFTGGYDLLAIWGSSGRKSDMIGTYGQGYGKLGGFDLGEVVIYERELSDADANRVQAILAKKWFNRDTEGCLTAETKSVLVETDAKLTLRDGNVTTEALGGGGTVDGDVIVPAGGELVAVVADDGSVGGLRVNGKLTLPADGRITFAGATAGLKTGRWTLVEADELDCASIDGWTVPKTVGRRIVSAAKVGNTIVLDIERIGFFMIVK